MGRRKEGLRVHRNYSAPLQACLTAWPGLRSLDASKLILDTPCSATALSSATQLTSLRLAYLYLDSPVVLPSLRVFEVDSCESTVRSISMIQAPLLEGWGRHSPDPMSVDVESLSADGPEAAQLQAATTGQGVLRVLPYMSLGPAEEADAAMISAGAVQKLLAALQPWAAAWAGAELPAVPPSSWWWLQAAPGISLSSCDCTGQALTTLPPTLRQMELW